MVLLLYKMTPEDISVMTETQLRTAPDMIPEDIIGMVSFVKVVNFEAPRLSAASSMLSEIFIMAAVADLLVNGIRRMASAMTMIIIVPVR